MLILIITMLLVLLLRWLVARRRPARKIPYWVTAATTAVPLALAVVDVGAGFKLYFAAQTFLEVYLWGAMYIEGVKRMSIRHDTERKQARIYEVLDWIHNKQLATVIHRDSNINLVLPDGRRVSMFFQTTRDPDTAGRWVPSERAIYIYAVPWWPTAMLFAVVLHELGHAVYNHQEPSYEVELEAELYTLQSIPVRFAADCGHLINNNLTNQLPKDDRPVQLFVGNRRDVHPSVPRVSA